MPLQARYVHTNLTTRDWRRLVASKPARMEFVPMTVIGLPRSSGARMKPVSSPVAWIGLFGLFWPVFMFFERRPAADTTRPDGVCALLVQGSRRLKPADESAQSGNCSTRLCQNA